MMPLRPPIVNSKTNPTEKRNAVVMESWPPHMVAIQVNILMPVGIAISIDVTAKALSAAGPMPTANMWWPHTP